MQGLIEAARALGRTMALRFLAEREAGAGPSEAPTGGHGLDGDEWVKALPYERTLVAD